jgi:hypothetical protein
MPIRPQRLRPGKHIELTAAEREQLDTAMLCLKRAKYILNRVLADLRMRDELKISLAKSAFSDIDGSSRYIELILADDAEYRDELNDDAKSNARSQSKPKDELG